MSLLILMEGVTVLTIVIGQNINFLTHFTLGFLNSLLETSLQYKKIVHKKQSPKYKITQHRSTAKTHCYWMGSDQHQGIEAELIQQLAML